MSVVNRMLQDIDRRTGAASDRGVHALAGVRPATSPTGRNTNSPSRRASFKTLLLVFVALLVLATLGWQWTAVPRASSSVARTSPSAASAPSAPPALSPSLSASSSGPLASTEASPIVATAPVATPVASAVTTPVGTSQTSLDAAASSITTPLPGASKVPAATNRELVSATAGAAERLKLSVQLSSRAATVPTEPSKRNEDTSASVSTSSSPPAVNVVQNAPSGQLPSKTNVISVPVRQVATDETIASARQMWTEGARASALTTLRDALAAAEASRSARAIAPLARELARLEVADNRPQAALGLLKRVENFVAEDGDAWALRGNAEQRLGLHAEAVQSHLMALRIKPNEGKWMVGAAISLAATGKLEEAQAWAERANERNALTPTIAAYLQQLGITIRR